MTEIKKRELDQLSVEEMQSLQGGEWKLFGHTDTAVAGTNCEDETAGCTQEWERTIYIFGIPIKTKTVEKGNTITGGCSFMLQKGQAEACKTCTMCSTCK